MLRKLLTESQLPEQSSLAEDIFQSLKVIQQKLEEEIANKQQVIDGSWAEIRTLRATVQEKDQLVLKLEKGIAESQRNLEGNRQIINKLLNDLDRLQQDIEWYKRTYESRSFLGTVKEKLFGNGLIKRR